MTGGELKQAGQESAASGLSEPSDHATDLRMDATDLMETLGKKEFRPVELHLADGRALPLPHGDHFLMFPSKKTALVFPDGVHFEVVDIASIVRVVPLAAGG